MPTILIVEDEPAIAANVEYALRTDGFSVVHVALGEEALRVLAAQPIDAIVLDVGLPDMNGFELCKQIRRSSQVPVLFVTARDDEVCANDAYAGAGRTPHAIGNIGKPTDAGAAGINGVARTVF